MTLKWCTVPNFKLNGIILHVVVSYKYVGHYISDDLSDDEDINRQRRPLFVQGNIIYCESLKCVPWVWNSHSFVLIVHLCIQHNYDGITKKSTITKLQIAFHNIFLMFLGMPKYESTSYLCTLFDIHCCQSVICKLVYGAMCILDSSANYIIKNIPATRLRYTSRIRKHRCSLLYINSWQNKLYFSHCVQLTACNVGW